MAVVLPAARGIPRRAGNGPLPANNWYLIQNSLWNSTFYDEAGHPEAALLTFSGSNGSYQITSTGEMRYLASVQYSFGDDPTSPDLVVFTITGRWSSASESGYFAFNNGADQDQIEGQWVNSAGRGGTWTGRRIPYIAHRVMNPPSNNLPWFL